MRLKVERKFEYLGNLREEARSLFFQPEKKKKKFDILSDVFIHPPLEKIQMLAASLLWMDCVTVGRS